MAVLYWLYIFAYLETAPCFEHTNTTENLNITLNDANDTFSDRNESLHFTELGITPTPSSFQDPTAPTSESVTAFPDQNEPTDTSIPTKPELPRSATAAPPLPVSGVLPTPVTEVISLCPCNLQNEQCDMNCCCDPDCTEELSLFTDCSIKRISSDPRLCKRDAVVYSLSTSADGLSRMQSSVQQEVNPDVFCIQSANYEKGMSFDTPKIPTEENFDSLFGQFVGFFFGRFRDSSATLSPEMGKSPGYLSCLCGDSSLLRCKPLESLEGTWTPVDPAGVAAYVPVLLESGDVCNNVVKQVKYIFKYSDAGEILNVMASFLLGAIDSDMIPIQQVFQITFLQEITSTAGLQFSGNPGYVVGLPLVAGTRTADGIVQTTDPKGSLTILQNSVEQDCLLGSSRRSPVLFGINMVSGCTLRLSDAVNCSLVSEVILWALKGQNFPDHMASFGNSLPQNPLDWVPIQNQTITSGTQTCNIPLSYHLEVKWTKYGTLVNPQAQIVSVMETILTNTSSLALLTNAGGLLSVTTSVSFVDVSASSSPGFKVPPTIDAKLPFDFFFPFV